MSCKIKKGLSYVLGDSNDNENHILPINAIQYSAVTNNFYTGGRDGTVKTWCCKNGWEHSRQGTPSQFNFNETFEGSDNRDQDIDQDIDERVLKLETAISSNPLPYFTTPYEDYNITNNYNIHFDWINDLKLVNNDRDLVSCSSDLSLKLINLHNSDPSEKAHVHKFSNVHTDYIKKLSYVVPEKTIVSGGLDGKVVLWDLGTLNPIQEIQTHSLNTALPNSIYSLANNNSNLISTGGPSNTINLYDKRLPNNSNNIKKLIGHQDNIRCLLMSDNFILSGSSDTTIKLWDLRNFKVYKNFDIHDDAIWSLSTSISSSPGIVNQCDDFYNADFKVFYSGDKGGKIVKTDLSYLSTNLRKDNLGFETFTGSDDLMDEKLGVSTIIAKTNSPIISLCCETVVQPNSTLSSTTLLASTELSLNRYIIPDTDQLSKYQYSRNCLDYILNHDNQVNDELTSGLGEVTGEPNDLNSDFYDIVSHLSIDTNNFDIQSSFSGNNYPLSVHNVDNTNEVVDMNDYNSMFLNTDGGPSMEYVNTYKEGLSSKDTLNGDTTIDNIPVEILLNPIPSEQVTQVPFNKEPYNKFPLTRKSIIAKRLFNNRRHILVLYLNGDLKIWDIFACAEIKTFPYESSTSTELTKDLIENRLKEMENIFHKYQTEDTLNTWCEVDIKSGKLLVTLKESMFNNVEIYYDELCKSYPYLSYKHPDNIEGLKNNEVKPSIDDRLPLAKILINSLFHQYAIYEWEFDNQLREELKAYKRDNRKIPLSSSYERFTNDRSVAITSNSSISNASSIDGSSSTNTAKRIKMFTKKSSKTNIHQDDRQTLASISSAASSVTDYPISINDTTLMSNFINSDGLVSISQDSSNEDSIMSMLQYNKKRYWEKYGSFGINRTVDSILRIYSNDPKYIMPEDNNEYKPLFYPHRLPSNLLIIIFEHSPELGNMRDLCSFHLDDITRLLDNSSTNEPLVNDLRNHLPVWIGKPVLYSKSPVKENPKIEFKLQEVDYTLLPPSTTIGGKSQKKIKRLPMSDNIIKLTSHNMLRVLKILTYITERFDGRTPEMKDLKNPSEWLALECKGQELPYNFTLQTIKTKIWKSSSEIELRFRRKYD